MTLGKTYSMWQRSLFVPCSYCPASMGEHCKTKSGKRVSTGMHEARWSATKVWDRKKKMLVEFVDDRVEAEIFEFGQRYEAQYQWYDNILVMFDGKEVRVRGSLFDFVEWVE